MKKLQKGILALGTVGAVVAPIVTTMSCSSLVGELDHRVINSYGELSAAIVGSQRSFDTNFTSGGTFSGAELSNAATVLPLMRTFIEGKDKPVVTLDPTTGKYATKMKFDEEQTRTIKLDAADGIKVNGTWYDKASLDLNKLPSNIGSEVVFKVNPGVHYVNYKNEETKYTLKGKDFLYAMIRTLYASSVLRSNGTINDRDYSDILPAFSESDNAILEKNDGKSMLAINNGNSYLFDLFNIDLRETIKANIAQGHNPQEFVIKFTGDGNKAVLSGFISNNSFFSPQSSEKIDELAQEWSVKTGKSLDDNPGIKYGISNYAYNGMSGVELTGFKEMVSVAPYIYQKYDMLDKYVIVQNKHFKDQSWVNDKTTIRQYNRYILPDGGDTNARILQRISNYKNGIETILNKSVYKSAQFEQFKEDPKESGYTYAKVFETGLLGKLAWDIVAKPENIKYHGNEGYNTLGYKLMYGVENPKDIYQGGFKSINGFMNGSGAKLRNIMNNAYNAYTMVQESTSASGKSVSRGILAPEQPLWSPNDLMGETQYMKDDEENYIFSRPTGSATQEELEKQYNDNPDDLDKSFKTVDRVYKKLGQDLEDVAKSVGATPSNKARIPVQFWETSDSAIKPEIDSVYKHILSTLNDLRGNDNKQYVEFVRADALTSNSFIDGVQSNRTTMMHYVPWGADYPLATSLYQGAMGIQSGSSAIVGALYHDLVTDVANPQLPSLVGLIENKFKNDFPTLNKAPSELETIFNKVTVQKLFTFIKSPSEESFDDKEVFQLLSEINKVVAKPFYDLSTDETGLRELATYYQNHAFQYSMDPLRGSVITKRVDGIAATAVVKKPWLTTAMTDSGIVVLQDYRVE